MTMFSLYELMDEKKAYQKACMEIVQRLACRRHRQPRPWLPEPNRPLFGHRPRVLGPQEHRRRRGGVPQENIHPLDLAFKLAEDHGIVLS